MQDLYVNYIKITKLKCMIFDIALKMWILTKSFTFNIFLDILNLPYLFVIIHGIMLLAT